MKSLLAASLVLWLFGQAVPAIAAPKPPRPTAGSGVLMVRPFPPGTPVAATVLTPYQTPGAGRLEEVAAGRLQLLAPVFGTTNEEIPLAVTERRGEWLQVVYDDAGREGWVRPERSWEYQPWEQYLKGRAARLLPGLRKPFYQLLREPAESAVPVGTLTSDDTFRLISFEGDWVLVLVGQERIGWTRWRDRDSRFTLTLAGRSPQKR